MGVKKDSRDSVMPSHQHGPAGSSAEIKKRYKKSLKNQREYQNSVQLLVKNSVLHISDQKRFVLKVLHISESHI